LIGECFLESIRDRLCKNGLFNGINRNHLNAGIFTFVYLEN
jgi:hypothetical protein